MEVIKYNKNDEFKEKEKTYPFKDNLIKKIKKENIISLIISINENDINKEIYFLDNIDDEDDEIKIKPEHDKLVEMNEFNTELYINDKKYKFQKFFKFENPG